MKSNRNQEAAITYGCGPLMIIAGPGSGKTYTITERVAYLIQHRHANPQSILVMTFSRAAAREMRERFMSKHICGGDRVTFGTFHSVFYRVLLRAYGSLARNYIFDDEDESSIRFDEMLNLTAELLRTRRDICEAVRRRYEWILIDEFQDIDDVQFEIVRMIAPPKKWYGIKSTPNITVVGDDDQSIYYFRGADPKHMLDFPKKYPGTKKIVLDINYRSSVQIVKAACGVIRHNKHRFKKNLRSHNGPEAKIDVIGFENVRDEYLYIAQRISEEIDGGTDAGSIAVLYRNNHQKWQLEQVFDELGLKGVTAMTFHRSKGLEFDEVWIVDANQGITPSYKARTAEELEEERRAFYVAMTRARKRLHIAYCRKIRERAAQPSEYIAGAVPSKRHY